MNVAWCTLLFRRERPFSHCSTPLKPLASVKSAPSRQNTSNPTVFFSRFQAIIRVWKTGHETRIPLPPVFTQRRTLKYVGVFFFTRTRRVTPGHLGFCFQLWLRPLKKPTDLKQSLCKQTHKHAHPWLLLRRQQILWPQGKTLIIHSCIFPLHILLTTGRR